MAWIDNIDPEDARGELADIYEEIAEKRGKVANIMKVHSILPGAMKAHMGLYLEIMFGREGLKREERELAAVTVSRANGCDYCLNHHAEALNAYWKDRERIENFIVDPGTAELSERGEAMVEYAVKLTRAPSDIKKDDVGELVSVGLSQREILSLNLIVAYFNFVNRIAQGLGVEFEPEEVGGYQY